MIFVKISQNFVNSPPKNWFNSQISVYGMYVKLFSYTFFIIDYTFHYTDYRLFISTCKYFIFQFALRMSTSSLISGLFESLGPMVDSFKYISCLGPPS